MSETWDPDRQDVAHHQDAEGGYPEAGYQEPGYPEPGYTEAGYQEAGYPEAGYTEAGYPEAGYPEAGYAEAGYQEAGYAEAGYPEAGYTDAGYPGAGYREAGYPEAGYPEAGAGYAGERGQGAYSGGRYQYDPYAQPGAGGRGSGSGGSGGGGAHARRPPPRPPRQARTHHPVLVVLSVVIVVIVLGALGTAYWVKKQVNPGGKLGPQVTVVIPKGSSSSKIGSLLAAQGVIHSGSIFPYYTRIKGTGTLYPGTYHLPKNESYSQVISRLSKGPAIVTDRLVIPEGFTVAQIAVAVGKLPHAGITAAQFLAAADGGQVRSQYQPAGTTSLEGLLYPATYPVEAGESADALLQQMVDDFNDNVTSLGLAAGAAKLKMTPYQVITVASMVEREASRAEDRGPVASVIYNRLQQNVALGIDSTLLYGLHTTNASVNPDTPNPYNTRINKGLPPTPISNPGTASLEAAIDPPATTYVYYAVTGPGGQTSFATTPAQFATIEGECQQRGYCS